MSKDSIIFIGLDTHKSFIQVAVLQEYRGANPQKLGRIKSNKLSKWMLELQERRGPNRAAVALANKLMRIAWAVTTKNEEYQPA